MKNKIKKDVYCRLVALLFMLSFSINKVEAFFPWNYITSLDRGVSESITLFDGSSVFHGSFNTGALTLGDYTLANESFQPALYVAAINKTGNHISWAASVTKAQNGTVKILDFKKSEEEDIYMLIELTAGSADTIKVTLHKSWGNKEQSLSHTSDAYEYKSSDYYLLKITHDGDLAWLTNIRSSLIAEENVHFEGGGLEITHDLLFVGGSANFQEDLATPPVYQGFEGRWANMKMYHKDTGNLIGEDYTGTISYDDLLKMSWELNYNFNFFNSEILEIARDPVTKNNIYILGTISVYYIDNTQHQFYFIKTLGSDGAPQWASIVNEPLSSGSDIIKVYDLEANWNGAYAIVNRGDEYSNDVVRFHREFGGGIENGFNGWNVKVEPLNEGDGKAFISDISVGLERVYITGYFDKAAKAISSDVANQPDIQFFDQDGQFDGVYDLFLIEATTKHPVFARYQSFGTVEEEAYWVNVSQSSTYTTFAGESYGNLSLGLWTLPESGAFIGSFKKMPMPVEK